MFDPRRLLGQVEELDLARLAGSGSLSDVFLLEVLKEVKEWVEILNIQVFVITLAVVYQVLAAIFGPRFLIDFVRLVLEAILVVTVVIACALGFCG